MNDNYLSYEKLGFSYIRNVLDENDIEFIRYRMNAYLSKGVMVPKKILMAPEAGNVFDDYVEKLLPVFENYFGINLFPTYSYCRKYLSGSYLLPHTDRPSCEFTASFTIALEGDSIWPIFLQDNFGNVVESIIYPGDCLMMNGTKLPHWRLQYVEGKWQMQLFLHYVNANGPNAYLKGDGSNYNTRYGLEILGDEYAARN